MQPLSEFRAEQIQMLLEDVCRIHRQRTVYIDWQRWNAVRLNDLRECVEQLLDASHCECWDDDLAFAFDRAVHDTADALVDVIEVFVFPPAIRAFNHQV